MTEDLARSVCLEAWPITIWFILKVEVFNLLFVIEQDKKHVVHCLDCAKKISPRLENVTVLNQFKMEELMSLYDNFQLGTVVCCSVSHDLCYIDHLMIYFCVSFKFVIYSMIFRNITLSDLVIKVIADHFRHMIVKLIYVLLKNSLTSI